MRRAFLLLTILPIAACGNLEEVGRAPALSPIESSDEFRAMTTAPLPAYSERSTPNSEASLWSGARSSLLGDRRASQAGDIMTVVIEIDDKAEISNTSGRARQGAQSMGISALLGLPQRLNEVLPNGIDLDPAVSTSSTSSFSGNGSVSRNEKLTLRVAVTVIERLPNGVLRIRGSQEVRVNFELRELIVTGFVRPEDISRQNEITYDKIAGARISYGGRGQISDVQQPRYGQQITDIILPF
ncbi:flagellar basal body L-ring protein FlgH [Phaeovulum sp.]|uniref:flagellar basal body L-ring protein FlgH n=1 Tax=Phaeovulum sp. TaxID=2934796 RepID=UPI0027312A51|nr:flagellar basal body L-ring protein FlgH [Phaeovulum sp.]MDP1669203.1 flagellar basal body L-ring protein FlgH [Phaeovulum sp.]MDZ4120493.1 flagellar basal body L-ring protein FlgH [Phaeovulum sp.]